MISKYNRYQVAKGEVQDWIQLPTKVEMDIFRTQSKQSNQLIFTSDTWKPQMIKFNYGDLRCL